MEKALPKWEKEINKTALKYHLIGLWVSVIFNLAFFVTDYFNVPDYWKSFFYWRAAIAIICFLVIIFYKKLNIPIQMMGFIPVVLIAVQNAYMWSVMDVEHFQKHAFAYMALFIGAGMFAFYGILYSITVVIVTLLANVIFLKENSSLSFAEIMVNGGLLTFSVALFSVLLIRMRFRLTKNELISRFALEESKKDLEEKNQEIMDSINYAKRIQSAILPPTKLVKEYLQNSFILYKPKDIVAGDFYWLEHKEGKVLFAAADCTGHGVPGAMVSVVCNNGLNRSVREHGLTDPGKILDTTREIVIQEFEKSEEEVKDGMDIALCSLSDNKLEYAGAHNPLWIIRKGAEQVEEIKANKEPIGKFDHPNPYTTHCIELHEGDTVYIFSDGYADQFGGEKGKKYKSSNFKRLLLSIQNETMERQRELINEAFENWKGNLEQIDDVCVIGVRV